MYYPKSKIIADRYTEGRELIYLDTRQSYTGYYYILADGRIFSGKNPNDGTPRQLVFVTSYTDQPVSDPDVFSVSPTSILKAYDFSPSKLPYDAIRLPITKVYPPVDLIEPQYTAPAVSYPSFTRYFARRANNVIFIEIDQQQYNRFVGKDTLVNWPSYTVFSLPWTTTGQSREQIVKANKNIVLLTEQRVKVPGLSQYLKNYEEFVI